jgi:hypothetical protein
VEVRVFFAAPLFYLAFFYLERARGAIESPTNRRPIWALPRHAPSIPCLPDCSFLSKARQPTFESGFGQLLLGFMTGKKLFDSTPKGDVKKLPRRRFLIAMGALVAAGTGLWRLLDPRTSRKPDQVNQNPIENAARPSVGTTGFSYDSPPLLLAVMDAIVPRFGAHPAASEIDLLPRLDRCLDASPEGPDVFRRHWPSFEREIRQRVPFRAGRPDPDALHDVLAQWHRDYATESDPSLPASYFEGLRRYVLLAYYTSPAGWASVDYSGPAHASSAARGGPLG